MYWANFGMGMPGFTGFTPGAGGSAGTGVPGVNNMSFLPQNVLNPPGSNLGYGQHLADERRGFGPDQGYRLPGWPPNGVMPGLPGLPGAPGGGGPPGINSLGGGY